MLELETERLLLDPVRETDKEDCFINISHDKRVLETFICRYAETMEAGSSGSFRISMKRRIPARSATGSAPASGIGAMQRRRSDASWNICSGKRA